VRSEDGKELGRGIGGKRKKNGRKGGNRGEKEMNDKRFIN
jgi:hypothetical protein